MSDLNFANSPINQSLSSERKIELYTQMVRIRRFEQMSLVNYQKPERMGGFLHLYIGQESVAVGTISLQVKMTTTSLRIAAMPMLSHPV